MRRTQSTFQHPRALAALATLVVVGATVGFGASPAGGTTDQLTGGCTATIDGQDAGSAQSVASAITVEQGRTVVVRGTAPGPITGYQVFLVFGPARIPAASGTVANGETSYTTTVNVADYATYGVGLYRAEGETTGTPCTGWAYIKVTGRSPFTTVAGAAATAMLVGGFAGMILSRPRRPKLPPTGAGTGGAP